MQKSDNVVEITDLTETFEGIELIEATLLTNVGGAAPQSRCVMICRA